MSDADLINELLDMDSSDDEDEVIGNAKVNIDDILNDDDDDDDDELTPAPAPQQPRSAVVVLTPLSAQPPLPPPAAPSEPEPSLQDILHEDDSVSSASDAEGAEQLAILKQLVVSLAVVEITRATQLPR